MSSPSSRFPTIDPAVGKSPWQARLLPSPVGRLVGARRAGAPPGSVVALLHPAERAFALAHRSTDSRGCWVAGRYCLALALAPLAPRVALLAHESGAPTIPYGAFGSISHKKSMTVAVASTAFDGLGVDLESVDRHDRELQHKVLTGAERVGLGGLGDEGTPFVTVHFALKEAVYKASPFEQQEDLEFQDIELAVPRAAVISESKWKTVSIAVRNSRDHYDGHVYRLGRWVLAIATRAQYRISKMS